MLVKMESGSGGGVTEFVFNPIVTNKSFTCEWNFDAEAIVMFYTANNVKHLVLFNDLSSSSPSQLWITNTSLAWQTHSVSGAALNVSVTSKTLSITALSDISTFTDVTVIPLTSVPTGY